MRDGELIEVITGIHEENYGVYGARRVWAEMHRQGHRVARCTVERLMRETGLRGLVRDTSPRTTRPAPEPGRPADLVQRDFTASRPNELWVADIERREALFNRVEVKDLHYAAVAAAG